MPTDAFERHLKFLSDRSTLLERYTGTSPQEGPLASLAESAMAALCSSLYDVLLSPNADEDLLKVGTLIEKLYSAVTERKIADLRAAKEAPPAATTPLDATTLAEIEAKTKLL